MSDDEAALVSEDESSIAPVKASVKWTDIASSQKVINNLEKFVINQSLDKSYKKIASDGIASSKRTLESLLARNGGHQNLLNDEIHKIDNKNYTLDANGRVCLVKNSSKEASRHQELLLLQKDTHELRCLREYLMLALEAIMHNHREMMVNYIKTVRQRPRQIPQSAIDNAMEKANTRIIDDFAHMTLAVDESIAREEVRSENRRKLKKAIEAETFLMRMMLEMEDIREANVADLVALWRSHQHRSSTKQESSSNQASGDSTD
uniref:THO complex subunit 7 n=1 Tax=Caenorhabditis tropicalis TaxID=1561998 RepID=A0A1I7UXN0_9PELO